MSRKRKSLNIMLREQRARKTRLKKGEQHNDDRNNEVLDNSVNNSSIMNISISRLGNAMSILLSGLECVFEIFFFGGLICISKNGVYTQHLKVTVLAPSTLILVGSLAASGQWKHHLNKCAEKVACFFEEGRVCSRTCGL